MEKVEGIRYLLGEGGEKELGNAHFRREVDGGYAFGPMFICFLGSCL